MKPTTIEALAAARIGRDAFQRIEKNAGTTAAVRAALARMLADQHQERAAWGVPPAPVPGEPMPKKTTPVEQRLERLNAVMDAHNDHMRARADAQSKIVSQRAELGAQALDLADARTQLADAQATIATQRAELDEVDRKLERTIGGMRKTTEAACARNRELETAVATLQAELDDTRAELDDARTERDNARTALERVSEQLARAMARILAEP